MHRLVLIALAVVAAGCMVGTDGKPQVLLNTVAVDGGDCPFGSRLFNTGVDSNGDGVLQASEVTSSIPVCAAPKIQSGEVSASYVNTGWTLGQGSGSRSFQSRVTFPAKFASVPSVVVALRWIDSEAPQRVEVNASATDAEGFLFTVRTWEASIVYGVIATWVAYGT